jgi:hypothetical protein
MMDILAERLQGCRRVYMMSWEPSGNFPRFRTIIVRLPWPMARLFTGQMNIESKILIDSSTEKDAQTSQKEQLLQIFYGVFFER